MTTVHRLSSSLENQSLFEVVDPYELVLLLPLDRILSRDLFISMFTIGDDLYNQKSKYDKCFK